MNELSPKIMEALQIFVSRHKKNPNVVGILLSGSYVYSKPDKNSDLDIFVVLKSSKMRERGNTWIKGYEIEYFMNPVNQIRAYFKNEKKPTTAFMFDRSIVLYKKGNILDELIREGRQRVRKRPKRVAQYELEFAKYNIDDLEKELEDTYVKEDQFAFYMVSEQILDQSLKIFYAAKKIYEQKPKRLSEYLRIYDLRFEGLFRKALLENRKERKFVALNRLIGYTEGLLGGKRAKEWKIRSKLALDEKPKRTVSVGINRFGK